MMGRSYAQSRNYDYGRTAHNRVSQLSPWIRTRLLTESDVVAAALARHALSSAEKFVQEVCWRTYWKGWLQHRPSVWTAYLEQRDQDLDRLTADPSGAAAYEAAITGQTGIAVFDAWMAELLETGYLHNHARMWASSIWIYTLGLPWALGADHFLRHLIDGDAASNTLGWRWVAGLHTQGKTYAARASNIETYAGDRFSEECGPGWRSGLDRLATGITPVAGQANPPAGALPEVSSCPDGPVGLLLTEEDLHPMSLVPTGTQVTAIAGLCLAGARSPGGAGQPARTFAEGAVQSGLDTSASYWSAPATSLSAQPDPVAQLCAWARDHHLTDLVTAEPPIGWVRPHLEMLRIRLASQGGRLHYLRRDWDARFWPHARKGFFALKKQIPDVLATLGLGR